MLYRMATVALNAYREAVRARVLIGLAGIAFAAAFYSLVVGAYTLNEAPRVVSDLGAAGISIFSIVVVVANSATTLHRELEQKTILPMLARPIRRTEYLLGKYCGTLLVVAVFIMADAGLILMMCAALGGQSLGLVLGVGLGLGIGLVVASVWWPVAATYGPLVWSVAMLLGGALLSGPAPAERTMLLSSSLLSFLEVSIIAAIATLFASFSRPFLTAVFTSWLVVIGRSADSLTRLPTKVFGAAIHDTGLVLSRIMPNLHLYVPARPLLTGEALDAHLPSYLGMAAVQALGWTMGLLAVAAVVFRRRDFL